MVMVERTRWRRLAVVVALAGAIGAAGLRAAEPKAGGAKVEIPKLDFPVHDPDRPVPPTKEPPKPLPTLGAKAPAGAVVLFDGTDLSKWVSGNGPAKWKVEDGHVEVGAKTGNLRTKDAYGDCEVHVEWCAPNPPKGTSQERGNSGVLFSAGGAAKYEVQVLDCYQNKTYADGYAAALYGQYPPLANVCLPPGEWQTYDIIYHGPRWDKDGNLTRLAHFTVKHNGVLVQDNVALTGPTAHKQRPAYKQHPEKMPIELQDHGNPVRFRNIWVRELKDGE